MLRSRLHITNLFILFVWSMGLLHGQQEVYMQNGRFRICNGIILDSEAGKNKGYYDHNENYTLTLSMPGAKSITLDFQHFCTELDNDVLSIFDGKDTNATLIGRYSGTKTLGKIVSTDSFITLHFISDKSVSCTGWSAKIIHDIIPPSAANLSISKNVSCNDSLILIKLNKRIPCDSFNINNTLINGLNINKIKPVSCTNGLSDEFEVNVAGLITQNGTYRIVHEHGYRDFCDSIYMLESAISFSVVNCPLTVELNTTKDTICLGDCVQLNTKVSGGNAAKYKYQWNASAVNSSSIIICPKKSIKIRVNVTDGNAIPGSDSVEIIVLDPPKVQNDTQVCYYNSPFYLKASPPGGKWFGKGIVNANDGLFNPRLAYGVNKVWYQIGTCSDTLEITSSIPWNLENVFCPGPNPSPVYWYGPTGGNWTGPKISQDGLFKPDSIGVFMVEYEWKGCKSSKTIRVESISVKPYDTTCESTVRDTLKFSPKGLIIRNFKGLLNAYWGWYNPINMGGPGNYDIIFQARGTCRDTQKLTVLPCFAGKDDTICPESPAFLLTGFRRTTDAYWEGKGIVNSQTGLYDPSWCNGQDALDTIWLRSSYCSDYKIIHILATKILVDSLQLCPELPPLSLLEIPTNKLNGIWKGIGITKDSLYISCNGPGKFAMEFSKNGCADTLNYSILPFAQVPKDTVVCNNIGLLKFERYEPGYFFGSNIDSSGWINISNQNSDSLNIWFQNAQGCQSSFDMLIKKPAVLDFNLAPSILCYKDTFITPDIQPTGGYFEYRNNPINKINTVNMGSGNHMVTYIYNDGICESKDSWSLFVRDTLQVEIFSGNDSICPGEYVTLSAQANGGTANYNYTWRHGQSGVKTLVNPSRSTTYTVSVNDGCSDKAEISIPIIVHSPVWLQCITSDAVCMGKDGYVVLKLINGGNADIQWSSKGKQKGDTMFFPAGNSYKAFVVETKTGCFKDTSILLPSFKGVSAQFSLHPSLGGNCYTPLDEKIKVYWSNPQSDLSGNYWLNELDRFPLVPVLEIPISQSNLLNKNQLKLIVSDANGCIDTVLREFCYKDTIISFLPSAFTPDGDGLNDDWKWYFYGANEIRVLIYNRWGQIVFESSEINGAWNGDSNNSPCMEGIYIVHIIYKGEKTPRRTISKSIMLLRDK